MGMGNVNDRIYTRNGNGILFMTGTYSPSRTEAPEICQVCCHGLPPLCDLE